MHARAVIALLPAVLFLNSAAIASAVGTMPDISAPATTRSYCHLSGVLTDSLHEPIAGATIQWREQELPRGTVTDTLGRFEIFMEKTQAHTLTLTIHAIGYAPLSSVIDLPATADFAIPPLQITLTAIATEVPGVTVTSPRPLGQSTQQSGSLHRRARQSLVPSNLSPTLTDPQESRPGSMHSGQIRLLGTNPEYRLNGLSIGQDPNHFQALTIIPSDVVTATSLQSLGASAAHQQLAAIDLDALPRYGLPHQSELQLSSVELSGSSRFSTNSVASVASVRQSLVSQLLGSLAASRDIKTIPPANFSDFFLATSARLRPALLANFSYLGGADKLSFNTGELFGESAANRAELHQQSARSITQAQLQYRGRSQRWSLGLSRRASEEMYTATPDAPTGQLSLHLRGAEECYGFAGSFAKSWSANTESELGVSSERTARRTVSLKQANWNFLPPFWNTDNPHPFQPWLNEAYGSLTLSQPSTQTGVYAALTTQPTAELSLGGGLRSDYFSELSAKRYVSLRLQAEHQLGKQTDLRLFYGTAHESPVTGLLEPYQVLIRDHVRDLTAVASRLTALSFRHGPVTVSLFDKKFRHLPVLSPVQSVSGPDVGLQMQGSGSARFRGFSVQYQQARLWHDRLSVSAAYTFSAAIKNESGTTVPHELDAPHRFEGTVDLRLGPNWTLGGRWQLRSGYPYSPVTGSSTSRSTALDQSRYQTALAQENSLRFPANGYLNLSAEYHRGNLIMFCSIANLTNRANAMVAHPRGFLYDTGLLPTLGIRLTF